MYRYWDKMITPNKDTHKRIYAMKRLLALLLAISCVLSMTACSKKPDKEEPYIPPVQGGYFQETEPEETESVSTTMPEVTEPPETEPVIEETEPVVEETEPAPTEPELTFIEEARIKHEGNELYFKYNLLSEPQKELYLMACEAVEAGNKTFYLGDLKIDVDPAQEALKAMWYDHPEYFWYTSQYTINYMETKAFSVALYAPPPFTQGRLLGIFFFCQTSEDFLQSSIMALNFLANLRNMKLGEAQQIQMIKQRLLKTALNTEAILPLFIFEKQVQNITKEKTASTIDIIASLLYSY